MLSWAAQPAPSKSSLRIASHRVAWLRTALHRITPHCDDSTEPPGLRGTTTPQPVYDAHVPMMVTRFPHA